MCIFNEFVVVNNNHCFVWNKFHNLGITLLRITSEELASTRDDITSDRKKYFHSNLSLCMPEVFQLLTQFLVIHAYGLNGIDLDTVPNTFLDRKLIQSLPKDNRLW